jgi:hypothetical protein
MKTIRLIPLLLPLALVAADAVVPVALFSRGDLEGWQEESFAGETDYSLFNENNLTSLRAVSNGTASGRYKKVRIDLKETPVLHWRWRVENILEGVDEQRKSGDDYPARVYVVFSGGLFFWRTRAINYVWSSNQPVGTSWSNAFTGNAKMVAVESGSEKLGQWVGEKRNIAEDYRRLFGGEPGTVDAVAIMTDTDNSGQSATAWYGDIWFAAE